MLQVSSAQILWTSPSSLREFYKNMREFKLIGGQPYRKNIWMRYII